MRSPTSLFLIFLITLSACNTEPCRKSKYNKVLSTQEYNSKEYQEELYRLIKENPEVTYYFENREEIMGQEYLIVNAYGDAFCGKLCLLIPQDSIIKSRLKETTTDGSQLVGLRFQRMDTGFGEATVLQAVAYVVD